MRFILYIYENKLQMDTSKIKEYFSSLTYLEKQTLLQELSNDSSDKLLESYSFRREQFNNKIGFCPNCSSKKYRKHGIDKSLQRYYCRDCKKTFTEYTGTWLDGLHHKDKVEGYLKLMEQEYSLDKITASLKINKKTAFDWRHKILSSVQDIEESTFQGITESDETFFAESQKGSRTISRKANKRGKSNKTRGISNNQVAVIVTADRNTALDLTLSNIGRMKKKDIEKAIGARINTDTILCTDSHVSYKGFAKDSKLEHIRLRSDLKQYVKNKIYHIQHVNSLHSRLKKWIELKFLGVSTKYLQNYLNWFHIKEKLKASVNYTHDFITNSLKTDRAIANYGQIQINYDKLMTFDTQT